MTITPWHDPIDFEIAQRHTLSYEQVIDWRGKLLPIAGEFEGLNIKEAREKIIEKLTAKGLVERVDEKYEHEVPVCYKCERDIEPQIKAQWFVRMQPLADQAIAAVRNKRVHILTEQHEKIFTHWLRTFKIGTYSVRWCGEFRFQQNCAPPVIAVLLMYMTRSLRARHAEAHSRKILIRLIRGSLLASGHLPLLGTQTPQTLHSTTLPP
jgi:hypothetical protein